MAGTDIMEIMEVRLRVEPQLAQFAAMRAKPDETARMRNLAEKKRPEHDADAKELWDEAFHSQIAQSARDQLFLSIFDFINHIRQDDAWQSIRKRAQAPWMAMWPGAAIFLVVIGFNLLGDGLRDRARSPRNLSVKEQNNERFYYTA